MTLPAPTNKKRNLMSLFVRTERNDIDISAIKQKEGRPPEIHRMVVKAKGLTQAAYDEAANRAISAVALGIGLSMANETAKEPVTILVRD